ncbi:MAG: caspase family protein [Neomegalonema sp.]|nr:caspase family protein [Neomegalonema sp.]
MKGQFRPKRRSAVFAALAFLGGLGIAASAQAKTYAIIVGIDEYAYLNDLGGAVNDARDIADAALAAGFDVQLLLNDQATRETIYAAWDDVRDKITAGDTLLFTFAGHGGQEPEFFKGEEKKDHLDETLILSLFDAKGDPARHRIRDNEVAELLASVPQAKVVFVADSCHSGTVLRGRSRKGASRYHRIDEIDDDPLPPPPPEPDQSVPSEIDNQFFIAAVPEALTVQEIEIHGQMRGALSYALAQALRGAADIDRDGVLRKGEMQRFVEDEVMIVSDGAQTPQIEPRGRDAEILFILDAEQEQPAAADHVFGTTFDELPSLVFEVSGGDLPQTSAETLHGIVWAEKSGVADLTWDLSSGEVFSSGGDLIHTVAPEDLRPMQALIDKMRVAAALKAAALAQSDRPRLTFSEGNERHIEGAPITAQITNRKGAFGVVFDLAADGTIQFSYPLEQYGDALTSPAAQMIEVPLESAPPFGADHMVYIETERLDHNVIALLEAVDGTSDYATLWSGLRGYMKDQPVRIAILPFFTAPGP